MAVGNLLTDSSCELYEGSLVFDTREIFGPRRGIIIGVDPKDDCGIEIFWDNGLQWVYSGTTIESYLDSGEWEVQVK